MKKLLMLLMLLVLTGTMAACTANKANTQDTTPTPTAQTTQTPQSTQAQESASNDDLEQKKVNKIQIKIEMEDGDVMRAVLYPDIAPITVANFVKLINEHFYDGLIFHRVIEDFMIQGGGYDANYQPKEADPIKGEFTSNGVENNLKHTRGVLSMARTNVKDSASSQFFIMQKDSPHLDGEYAAFGEITEGIDVVDKIASVQTGAQDVPVEPQVIKTITIEEQTDLNN